ncbi:MAG: primosomal protein N' [Chthonomonadales bacterium]
MAKRQVIMQEISPVLDILVNEFVTVADVVVDVSANELQDAYTYRIPSKLNSYIVVGCTVQVPFGPNIVTGYAIGIHELSVNHPLYSRLKTISAVVDSSVVLTSRQIELAKWLAQTTFSNLIDNIKLIAPTSLGISVKHAVKITSSGLNSLRTISSGPQTELLFTLREMGGSCESEKLRKASQLSSYRATLNALQHKGFVVESYALSEPRSTNVTVRAYELGVDSIHGASVSPTGQRILDALRRFASDGESPVLPERLLQFAQCGLSAVKTLVTSGIVRETTISTRRNPLKNLSTGKPTVQLSVGQRSAVHWVRERLTNSDAFAIESKRALLFGVTASGKTEVYLNAIEIALDCGKSSLLLVPEIALTSQIASIITSRFGDEVALLHSGLSDGERYDEWKRIKEGRARIVVGPRSAVFAPLENIGLVILDEEHDSAYKQENHPRYNARDVGMKIQELHNAVILLGSATPSMESFYATSIGNLFLLEMPDRVENRKLPDVQVVDMRSDFARRNSLFSEPLELALHNCINKGKQSILLLNRRGYNQFILCRECGFVAKCPSCSVSLSLHRAEGILTCHHCGFSKSIPTRCPDCKGEKIKGFGLGTEKLQSEVEDLVPGARVIRLDRDTTLRKGSHETLLKMFRERKADILVGTQMVAKGLDFPDVTLVGVVSADTSVFVPDFRAAERTFQLLTQVSGRAGRGDQNGQVIVQSFAPDHYSIKYASTHDYKGFYAEEIEFRKELNYPPYRRFVLLTVAATDERTAKDLADSVTAVFRNSIPKALEIVGPSQAPIYKRKNAFRWHTTIRLPLGLEPFEVLAMAIKNLSSSQKSAVAIDVDPISMM